MEKIKGLYNFVINTLRMRKLIFKLAKNDFKSKYAGSYFGLTWGFVQPIVTILIYWFVFTRGIRSGSHNDKVPFILWFMTGIIPWFYFADALSSATASLLEYSYLVKKIVFRTSVLPMVKLVSALFIHLFFILILFIVYAVYGFGISIYNIQFIYYTLCMIVLLVGLSWLTSAVIPFFRDLGQIISIMLQFGLWLTPIMWPITSLSSKLGIIFRLNPIYYIVDGYRDTFINHIWFFEKPGITAYYWSVTIIILLLGIHVFKKLKPHFADVL